MRNTTKKKIAPIVITALVLLYMTPLIVLAAMAVVGIYREGLAAVPLLLLYLFLGGAVVIGILKALLQRLREIDGGEEEEAGRY